RWPIRGHSGGLDTLYTGMRPKGCQLWLREPHGGFWLGEPHGGFWLGEPQGEFWLGEPHGGFWLGEAHGGFWLGEPHGGFWLGEPHGGFWLGEPHGGFWLGERSSSSIKADVGVSFRPGELLTGGRGGVDPTVPHDTVHF
uniref:Uncharacterized protein n=1 Tax=Oryzias latipes TaxID=8090 RepID=A0A3P9L9H9_ORYLA